MNRAELDQYGPDDLRALLAAATDDLLRLCAVVLYGSDDGGESDAASLQFTWAWTDPNTYSDGTCIVATATHTHIYAPPGRTEKGTRR